MGIGTTCMSFGKEVHLSRYPITVPVLMARQFDACAGDGIF